MRHRHDDHPIVSSRVRQRHARAQARARAARVPAIDPWLLGLVLMSVLAALVISVQSV